MKSFFNKYWHALLGLYIFIYMPVFNYLEANVVDFNSIHCALDDYIPFCEYFVIPYLFWFVYIALACVYFFLASQKECMKFGTFLIIGMTLAMITCYVYPNGTVDFRPEEFSNNNIFTRLVKYLYSIDTPTNVFPSLHCYNSIAVTIAIIKSEKLKNVKWISPASIIITILICLSTLFLKQHSVLDVLGAVIMAAIVYPIVYKTKMYDNLKW